MVVAIVVVVVVEGAIVVEQGLRFVVEEGS